jgi:hypothetical protein
MQKRLRGSKRAIVKKVTAVNLFADQATQIQAIMEASRTDEVAPLIRQLLDEALAARRRRSTQDSSTEMPPPKQEAMETLQTIQTLLLKLIRQSETSIRTQGISLILLQEVLAESVSGRRIAWSRLEAQALADAGVEQAEIGARLDFHIGEAKDYAYGLAEEIRRQQDVQSDHRQNANGREGRLFD